MVTSMSNREKHSWNGFRSWLVILGSTIFCVGCASNPPLVSCQSSSLQIGDLPERGISAHRGGRTGCPDNSLGAFQRAICLGVHQIELDVRTTKDKVLVVAHDDAMTGQHGDVIRLSQSTLAEVKRLNLGACSDGQTCEQHIPTLEEVLAIMPMNIWINLDVKENRPEVGRQVVSIVAQANRLQQTIFSVRDKAARAIREYEKETAKQVWISNMSREFLRRQYVESTISSCNEFIQLVNLPFVFRGKPCDETMDRLKQARVRVNYSWLRVDKVRQLRDELADLFERRVDFVLVDHPKAAMQAAQSLGIIPIVPRWKGPPPFPCSEPPQCSAAR